MIAGKDASKPGEGKNSWLTGTASWNYYAITQYILGIRPDYDGLLIDPCIPSDWKEYKITRVFRGDTYNITISNPSNICKGVLSMIVDGKTVKGNIIPIAGDKGIHSVEIILGE